jgi:serine/threonine protein phosphatase PrpC
MRVGAKSHKGLVRTINEDSILVKPDLYAVADGMGGHKAGEVASAVAIMRLAELDFSHGLPMQRIELLLKQTITGINEELYSMSNEIEYAGMGTTLTCLVLQQKSAVIGHVGDSRVYLIRNTSIAQITRDHSVTNELVQQGGLTEEEAKDHPYRNVLTRALGTDPTVQIDTHCIDLAEGDWIMLCTDGLTAVMNETEIVSVITSGGSPEAMVHDFINIANDRGGPDNTSVILIGVGEVS